MDAKTITFGETGTERLARVLRTTGQPQDLQKLTERYLEILREMVLVGEQNTEAAQKAGQA